MARKATLQRKTRETNITLTLDFDATGGAINTPVGFFNHMLESFAKHSGWCLTIEAAGDTHVDDHHTVEDVGICLGLALKQAIGEKQGMARFGSATIPMDEALAEAVVDFGGRGYCVVNGLPREGTIGTFAVELTHEFFQALAMSAEMNLHLNVRYGSNRHHIVEAAFKALAHACRQAVMVRAGSSEILSTKGTL
ncbi:imidazoleglycerol-phosphate dehydratase HisB [Chrysiogenes arsenatis]|uniref:imidazoleglycerol-phosphate dehydratase HisB n=1 Tax=Chrysiogenes arsenatis TaxID=309797 RepID=UPI000426A01B|nr:imidazoleglycerol-phosphate dehydratase HisB [Chrysiogenes arsenatis]